MMTMTAGEIAAAVGGQLLCGDAALPLSAVSIDSRQGDGDTLYIPIVGERNDGHTFLLGASETGMRAAFWARSLTDCGALPEERAMTLIGVKDTRTALQALAAAYRSRFTLPLIGISGSVGKTTTKEMIAAVLETKYCVLKTLQNQNSQLGLPLMMLALLPTHEIAVIEMGMSLPGEMERLADIARPTAGVLTNIGMAHIGQLGSQENIRKAKLNLINRFSAGSRLLVCGNDPLLRQLAEQPEEVAAAETTREALRQTQVLCYGIGETFDYAATQVTTTEAGTHFVYRARREGITEQVFLPVLGRHHIQNAVAALSIGLLHGVAPSLGKEGLANWQPPARRGNLEQVGGLGFINDTYNASPDSMKSGIDVLLATPCQGKRVAVLGDILELGAVSADCHFAVGQYVAERGVDLLVTVGTEARQIANGARTTAEAGTIEIQEFETRDEAFLFLREALKQQDLVLLKGSRGMRLELLLEQLKTIC